MSDHKIAIQFCGFGGQGIVLSSIIFGSAAVIGANLYAVQTQSYGSEARGGECQAELIIASEPIGSPVSDRVDILIAMSQMAYRRYQGRLRDHGRLVIDPDMVSPSLDRSILLHQVPASRLAEELGAKIAANMVMLGFLQQMTQLVSADHLLSAIQANVPERFLEVNLKAARLGMRLAEEESIPSGV
jgi:2-oxoglutarate ferredoxin oxidoreductase subunit gamma